MPSGVAGSSSHKDRTGVTFSIESRVPAQGGNAAHKREHDKRIASGTMSRSGAKCPCCGTIMTMEDIRVEGKAERLNSVMTTVVVDGQSGKEYRLPTQHEIRQAEVAQQALASSTRPSLRLSSSAAEAGTTR